MSERRDYPNTSVKASETKTQEAGTTANAPALSIPSISVPKGGGAIRGIGEKFDVNAATGTGSLTVPLAASSGRSNFGPQLSLSYDSGAGNGPFGLGWSLSLPSISRKTDKGLPKYRDNEPSDDFILSGAEDLVPVLVKTGKSWSRETLPPRMLHGETYKIERYRPRIEGLFARIERWTNQSNPGDSFWRSISRDNITTWYGKSENSRIFDPNDSTRIFSWLICESYDAKGNVISYEYKKEDSKQVDLSQVHERNRTLETRSANRYPKSIKYGNRSPYFPVLDEQQQPTPLPGQWLFEIVFDYGEHDPDNPEPDEPGEWTSRNDPFSSYRSGFEVRTYRLCQRMLMFHHFPNEVGIGNNCLVRSTDFSYFFENNPTNSRNPIITTLAAVTQTGYKRNGPSYLKKSQPALEFEYSQPEVQNKVWDVDPRSLENLPSGFDDSQYRWVDLDGEGLSGILTEQGQGWFYKRNLSPINTKEEMGRQTAVAAFAPLERVATRPSLAQLSSGGQQFIDLAGDGQLDLVDFNSLTPGFYERTVDEQWEAFKTFQSLPNLDWSDPNLKFIDLTGDGHADILISEQDAFAWYPSLGESGFGPREKVRQVFDEEKGPRLIFVDGAQSIYLADMSGDGLNDLVRIRNSEICYWPNLGYGRFGSKITMDNAPLFDATDQFALRNIRLADIDGSGVADIIYFKHDGVHIYFNQSGNSWSLGRKLAAFPRVDDRSNVQVIDLLGSGTVCLVWSSTLPANARGSMRYIDLMGGQKPHLMLHFSNNLGAETVITYAPSTRFYLADKLAGNPWLTKIPFPVQVVERVEIYDHISRNRFVTRYAYHHGYFDGVEREFRGFGMVEQWDTEELASLTATGELPVGENFDESSYVPPVHTKTWFHTGVYFGGEHISDHYAGLIDEHDRGEYYRETAWQDDDIEARKHLLDDTLLPTGLSGQEPREAARALKGSMLRQEVYADDGSDKAQHPYTVVEQNFSIELLQASGDNRHAVFFTHARETINYSYERNAADPRIAHTLTLQVDEFGNTLRSVAVAYPRADVPERLPQQNETHVTLTISRYANRDDQADWRHIGLPVETRAYEVVKPPTAVPRFAWEELNDLVTDLIPLNQLEPALAKTTPYEEWDWRRLWNPIVEPGGLVNSKLRLIEHVQTYYRPDDLGLSENNPLALLPLGTVESLALPGDSYKLAFTSALLTRVYQRPLKVIQSPGSPPPENLIPNHAAILGGPGPEQGGYIDLANNGNWWVPTGRMFFSPSSLDTPTQELAHARSHFFLPHRYRDPFHTNAASTDNIFRYDNYDLLVLQNRNAVGNIFTVGEHDINGNVIVAGGDYRMLQPRLVMDPNRNRSFVAFDALGMVVATAISGKPEESLGDSLAGLDEDLSDSVILDHIANPLNDPQSILQRATTRLVYDLFSYQRTKGQSTPQPAVVYTLARETHDSEPAPAGGTRIQHGFSYSDGFGREIQKKIQAEPGPAPQRDGNGKIIVGPDNQPLMTASDVSPRWVGSGWTVFNNKSKPVRQYEPFFTGAHLFEFDLRIGVSPVVFYDPVERVVATLHANHTWEKTVFDPWQQETWDVNDTVLVNDPKTDGDIGDCFRRLPDSDYLPSWHTQRENGALGPSEQAAARKTAVHAATPTRAHTDSLGRTFLTVAHNKFKYSDMSAADPAVEEFYETRVVFDCEANQREIVDARNRSVVRYEYNMLGHRIHNANMDAGERWTLNDVSEKPLYAWDSRDCRFRTAYDPLRRPTGTFIQQGSAPELLTERRVYGETKANPESGNLRGQVVDIFDQAGVLTSDDFDFKGNRTRSSRRLASEYQTILNWSGTVALEPEIYTSHAEYDALNRPTALTTPDNSVVRPSYNVANLLERIDVNLRGVQQNNQPVWTTFVSDIDYDAKGLRTLVDLGNGVRTTYSYDPFTFRLSHMLTARSTASFPDDCPQPSPAGWPGCQVQNLHYTYDAAGNVSEIHDEAQQTVYFRNKRVEPTVEYIYDAVFRLIESNGREHLGQVGGSPVPTSYNDTPRVNILFSASDGNAMGRYLERYSYDAAGNLQTIVHRGSDPVNPGWTRGYTYDETSLIEPSQKSNRLTRTTVGATTENYSIGEDGYDAHGSMLRMPQLQTMQWNFKDELQMVQRQAVNADDDDGIAHQGERTWYVYDSTGQRVRKVTEAQGQIREERIYLGGFEVYRRQGSNPLVRETLHIMDSNRRVAIVETRVSGNEPGIAPQILRYQFSNHLDSVALELDEQAQVLSYEEYFAFGSSSFHAMRNQTESARRYRYTGKERDEESGFYYHGARYYAPWLARWTAADPIGVADGTNLYAYVKNNPVILVDPNGKQNKPVSATDNKIMQMTDPQLYRHMKGLPDEFVRKEFVDSATGAFQNRARAMANRYKMRMSARPVEPKGPATLEEITIVGEKPSIKSSVYQGFQILEIPVSATPYVIARGSGQTFTDAAIKTDTGAADEVMINTSLYNGPKISWGPADPAGITPQGLVIQSGTQIAGRTSPDTFHFTYSSANSTWSFGKGDPSASAEVAMGGGKPLVIGGLKYGGENQYKAGAPAGLPQKGDPGADNNKWLTQRSNAGIAELEGYSPDTGFTLMGIDRDENTLYVAVKEHGTTGAGITGIRDYLVDKKGVDDALVWDSSTSSTLIRNNTVVAKPSDRKNDIIPIGLGFRFK